MGDITPLTSASSLFPGRQFYNSFHDSAGFTPAVTNKRNPTFRYKTLTKYFSGVTDTTNWALNGACAVAWQANELTDLVGVRVDSGGRIGFSAAGAGSGWVHVLIGGAGKSVGGSVTPVNKGTPGYIQHGAIFENHRHATPNTLTAGKVSGIQGFDFRVFPFTLGSASDRWTSESAGLCPGIVAVAWQANDPLAATEDHVAVTLNASGDVIFTAAAGGGDGWLWAWRRRL